MNPKLHAVILKLTNHFKRVSPGKTIRCFDGNDYSAEDLDRIAKNRAWSELGCDGLREIEPEEEE